MKKCLYLLLATSLFIISCNRSNKIKRLEDNSPIYGKVKMITQTFYNIKEKFGELQKDGNSSTSYYYFDKKGNLIKEDAVGSNWDSTIYIYDAENWLIREDYYRNGIVEAKTVYEYSNSNTKRKETYTYQNNLHVMVSKFDKDKNRIELDEYNDDGTPSTKHTYEYDNSGNMTKQSGQLPNEKASWTYYNYDNKDNRIEEKFETSKFNFKFENFDKYGNWLKQTAIDDKPFYIIERRIEYYE